MKKLLILAALILTGCIVVDDLDVYWDKGILDPALLGRWQEISSANPSPPASMPQKISLIQKNGTYQMVDYNGKVDPTLNFKILRTGKYSFFMSRAGAGNQGVLYRYVYERHVLTLYTLNYGNPHMEYSHEVNDWLQQRYPHTRNIVPSMCSGPCRGGSLHIRTLDGETLKILAEIPDTQQYWIKLNQYQKIQ